MVDLKKLISENTTPEKETSSGIRIKGYLPYQEKVELASYVFRNVIRIDEETGLYYAAHNEDFYEVLGILKFYAAIDAEGLSFEEAVSIYDYARSSGLMDEINEFVGRDIGLSLSVYYRMRNSILDINAQTLSVGHQMQKMMNIVDSPAFTTALTNAKLQGENAVNQIEELTSPQKAGVRPLMNFAKK